MDRTNFGTFAAELTGSTDANDVTSLDGDVKARLPKATPYDTTQLLPIDQSVLTLPENEVVDSFEENRFDQIVRNPLSTTETFLLDTAIDRYAESTDNGPVVEPQRLGIDNETYALILSNLGDLKISWIVHPNQLGDTKGISSSAGHVYVEALNQTDQSEATRFRDNNDNGDIWFVGYSGDLADIRNPEQAIEGNRHVVVDIDSNYVFTAVADNQLVIESQARREDAVGLVNRSGGPYATLRSTNGRVTDVEPYFTFDDRSPVPVDVDGPILVLTPPEEDRAIQNPPTSRFVIPVLSIPGVTDFDAAKDVPQNVQFTQVGSVSEQNLTLVFAWADFDMGQFETAVFRGSVPTAAELANVREIINGKNISSGKGIIFNTQNVVVLSDPNLNDTAPIGTQNFTNIFSREFLAKNPISPDLPTSIFLFNDPNINLFESAIDGEPDSLNETTLTIGAAPTVETDGTVFVRAISDVAPPFVSENPVVEEPIVFVQQRVFVADPPIVTVPDVIEFDDVRPFVLYLPRVIYGAVVDDINEEWLDEDELLEEKDVEPGKENIVDEVKTEIDNRTDWPRGEYLIIEYDSNGQMINKSRYTKELLDDDDNASRIDDFGLRQESPPAVPVAIQIDVLPYWQRAAAKTSNHEQDPHEFNATDRNSTTNEPQPSLKTEESAESEHHVDSESFNSDKPVSRTARSLGAAILLSKVARCKRQKDEVNKAFCQSSSGSFAPSARRRRRIRSKYFQ